MEQICVHLGFYVSLLTVPPSFALFCLAFVLLQTFCVKYMITPEVRASVFVDVMQKMLEGTAASNHQWEIFPWQQYITIFFLFSIHNSL